MGALDIIMWALSFVMAYGLNMVPGSIFVVAMILAAFSPDPERTVWLAFPVSEAVSSAVSVLLTIKIYRKSLEIFKN